MARKPVSGQSSHIKQTRTVTYALYTLSIISTGSTAGLGNKGLSLHNLNQGLHKSTLVIIWTTAFHSLDSTSVVSKQLLQIMTGVGLNLIECAVQIQCLHCGFQTFRLLRVTANN